MTEHEKMCVKTETLKSLIKDSQKLIELNEKHGMFVERNASDRLDLMIYEELLKLRETLYG